MTLESPIHSDETPEVTPIVTPILAMQKAFADAALVQIPGEKLKRPQLEAILRAGLFGMTEEVLIKALDIMELRGVIPSENNGKRSVEGLSEEQQNVLRDPDGLLKQCARLANGAQLMGRLLNLSEEEVQNLTFAGMLLYSDKARLFAGLESDKLHCDSGLFNGDSDVFILEGYNRRELLGIHLLQDYGVPSEIISILSENIRHDPRKLRTFLGGILYFLLYSQLPDSNYLAPVEQRINASMKGGMYAPLYAGYAKLHANHDLVGVHEDVMEVIEREIADALLAQGHSFDDLRNLRTFLNERLGFTPPAPLAPAQ